MKQRLVQKLVAVGATVLAVALATEGYLQVRQFVVATQQSSQEVARLRHELGVLYVMLENMPQGSGPRPSPVGSFGELPPPVPVTEFPLPEAISAKPKASSGPRMNVSTDKLKNADGGADGDTVVLLNASKAAPADPTTSGDTVVLLNASKVAPVNSKPQPPSATPPEPTGGDVKVVAARK